ncbi:MAG: primosomal protein N' [Pseudomonadota bacterium]
MSRIGVMLPMPFVGPLDYRVPDGMALDPGDYVAVELGSRRVTGVVWGASDDQLPLERLKTIQAHLAVTPMRAKMRQFIDRMADYTMTPPGMVLRLATRVPDLGAPEKRRRVLRRGLIDPARVTSARQRILDALSTHGGAGFAPSDLAREAGVSAAVVKGLVDQGVLVAADVAADAPFPPLWGQPLGAHLSEDQQSVAAKLRAEVINGGFSATLVYGVTGSGKTEVYLEAVAECLAKGRQALVLVPEVALTSAFLDRVEARFGARPAEWHHGVTPTERRRAWHAVAKGDARLVVGARSSLFLPFCDLGLIVIDEEHESSYKQEEQVFYHARDMAVLRASIEGAAAILASATPSLETWVNAEAGKYKRLDLPTRFGAATLPNVRMIDLKSDNPGRGRWLSDPLINAAKTRLDVGEQVLFFLNRRGYAPLTLCRSCGHHFGCPTCDARLVTHRFRNQLLCHQCGHTEPLPKSCPACGRDDALAIVGPGVERLAEEVGDTFPNARVDVLSSDLMAGPGQLRERLDAIAQGQSDIVVGTQMIAKGHNFPNLTLVGVIDADMGLQGGDLRASEKTFQLLHQVSGRAGRADKKGTALIQTVSPDHAVMRSLLTGQAEAFWKEEAQLRHAAGAPPFGRMAGVIVSGKDERQVWEVGRSLGRAGTTLNDAGIAVFGPAPAPFARIRGKHRVRLLLKAPKGVALQRAIRNWLGAVKVPAAVMVQVDIDPQSFL